MDRLNLANLNNMQNSQSKALQMASGKEYLKMW